MNYYIKKKLLALALLILIPINVNALTSSATLSCTPTTVSPDSTISCTLKGTTSGGSVSGVSGTISLPSGMSLVSCSSGSSWQGDCDNGNVGLYTDSNKTGTFDIASFVVKVDSGVANSTKTISFIDGIYSDENFDSNSVSTTSTSVSIYTESSVNTLKNITLSTGSLSPSFSSSTTSYSVSVDSSSIVISATATDSEASVSGAGTKSLSYGLNTFEIVVTAENGSKKTYTIKVTRNDNRSTNNNLSNIIISEIDFNFSSIKTEYDLEVVNDISSLEIEIETEDETSEYEISNTNLTVGENVITIVVTSETGEEKTYTLNVTRLEEDEELKLLSSNNYIINMEIANQEIDFDKNTLEYNVVTDEDSLEFNIELDDSGSIYEIINNNNLEDGSVITIKVTAEDGSELSYFITIEEPNNNSVTIIILFSIIIVLVISIIVMILLRRKRKNK